LFAQLKHVAENVWSQQRRPPVVGGLLMKIVIVLVISPPQPPEVRSVTVSVPMRVAV
jgi:hypothetical protein